MRLILLWLIPTLAFALTSTDRFDVQILKVYDRNILVLNRGLEDGIIRNDHIKLTNSEGFLARGICIKEGLLSSHWKIYRVIRPELLSKDTVFYLNSINQSELPEDIEEQYASVNFENNFEDWNEKDLQRQLKLQQQRFAKYDFPNSTDGTDIYPENKESYTERLIAKNFNKRKFMKDMKPLMFTVFASPYSSTSLNEQQTANYGLGIHNKGEKYDIIFNYADDYMKIADPIQNKSIVKAERIINAEFIIRDFTSSWDLTTYAQYDWARFGGVFTPRQHIKVAPFGMRFEIEPKKGVSYSDLSYFLFYDHRVDDKLEPIEEFDPNKGGIVVNDYRVDQTTTSRVRHGFRLRLQGMLNKNITYYNELWYQPAMSLATWNVDTEDVDMYNLFRLSVLLGDDFYLDLENHYSHDILLKDNYGIEPSIITNVVHFRYNFDI